MKYIVYHGTSADFNKFDLKKSAQGIIWFSDDKELIKRGESGAAGRDIILKCQITINNPAGWDEYEKLGLGQLQDRGYDGVILPDSDHNTFFVFRPSQVKILEKEVPSVDLQAQANARSGWGSPLHEQLHRMKNLIGLKEGVVVEYTEKNFHLMPGELDRIKDEYGVTQTFEGTYGVAYLTSVGTIIKITSDLNEVGLAKKLIGRHLKHYVNILGVQSLKGQHGYKYYLIHMEYLEPLKAEEKEVWEIIHYLPEYFSPKGMWKNRFKGSREDVLDQLRNDAEWNPGLAYALQHGLGQNNAAVLGLYDAYTAIHDELKRFKVTDVHKENVGRKKDGTIAAFDLRQ